MDIIILHEALNYDAETGLFLWKKRPLHHFKNSHGMNIWNSKFPEKLAGTIQTPLKGSSYKRVKITLGNKPMMAHQAAWLLVHGGIPNGLFINHVDGNATNNAIKNLRLVTHSENHRNRNIQSNNSSGVPGVRLLRGKWCARIKINGKEKHLGSFQNKEQAVEARKQYAISHGFTERHYTDRRS